LLVGISRKSFLSTVTGMGSAAPSDRDGASHVLHGLLSRHCALLRAHDVPGAMAACRLASAVRSAVEADDDQARGRGADV
ncbi:MAG: hypothetical protein H0W83_17310, partial [Planctomycetes bacterium]|nr:hypothetical protein [Planctomycetota bacterium]